MVGGRGGSSEEVTFKLGLAGWVGVDEEGQSLAAVRGMCGCSGPGRRLRPAGQAGQARVGPQG